ncbi:NAD(P)-binding domain-containing protein, partial [Bradyrhizobium sp.]|uniref:NAD(P)-binding domain-containing protein n=1 Tax=Bradyrhizobium sp. TaxID=376 RepID=UPI003C5C365E
MNEAKTVAIIGAGPVGLAAAAQVLERGMTPVVLEAGAEPAHAVRQWQHVRLFSPWEYNVDKAAGRLLAATGWNSPDPKVYPTGAELIERYLDPLATRTPLRNHILRSSRVTGVSRQGFDRLKTRGRELAPFEIRYRNADYPDGLGERVTRADAVIDASGTWSTPSPAGANGLSAIGEKDAAEKIAYAMPDVLGTSRARYIGKTVAVLGAGHSAIGTLIDLAALKDQHPETGIIWLLRGEKPEQAFGGGANDKLAARGELGSTFAALVAAGKIRVEPAFRTTHIAIQDGRLRIAAGSACCGRNVMADELIVATGFRPEFEFLRELRIQLDPAIECPVALAPLIDPNEHSCG